MIWSEDITAEMDKNAKQEYDLAVSKGHIDENGIANVTVIVDGGWSRRSFGHSYNALSGVAVIIGKATGKLLFFGVKNKYCSICARAEKINATVKQHICFKNWDKSSSSMESAIIVEGFNASVDCYKLRYTKFVGDGDSSVFAEIKKNVHYGAEVEKSECTNHCIKNYKKHLLKIKSDTKGVSLEARKLLTREVIDQLAKTAHNAIYVNVGGDFKQLKEDIRNSVDHVFGNHTKCSQYMCEKNPTITPYPNFSVADDGNTLREAMKGLGTDEDTIIDILTTRSNAQRQQIAKYFKETLERDLIDDLKSELGGHFEDVIVALVLPPDEYLCQQLNKAMEGMGTNEHTLIEIICSKSTSEITRIVETYERMYERPLTEHMCSETGGDLRRLLTLILTGTRDDSKQTNRAEACEKAEALYADGEGRLGTHESTFGSILAHENFNQLKLIFEEYKEVSGNTIEQALNHELSGDYLEALLAIVEYIQSPPAYYAARLYKAMHGLGTNDTTLIRIVVSRSEIDLGDVKDEFERLYNKTLSSYIDQGETTGDYKKALLAIIK